MRGVIVALVGALFLGGCASLVSKADWPVTFTAAEPAEFTVTDSDGTVRVAATTPHTVTLPAGGGFRAAHYTVRCGAVESNLNGTLNWWCALNGLFGVGGVVLFAPIDMATGASWRLPEVVRVDGTKE